MVLRRTQENLERMQIAKNEDEDHIEKMLSDVNKLKMERSEFEQKVIRAKQENEKVCLVHLHTDKFTSTVTCLRNCITTFPTKNIIHTRIIRFGHLPQKLQRNIYRICDVITCYTKLL